MGNVKQYGLSEHIFTKETEKHLVLLWIDITS